MINFRNIFLVLSVCVVGNIYSSEASSVGLAVDGELEAVALQDNVDSKDTVIKTSTSSAYTKLWYGAAKHVAGKTAYAIFMELHDKGTLLADYDINPNEPMNRFNEAVAERFTKKTLLNMDKQEKINKLFINAHRINREFVLAKALASKYLTIQEEAVNEILTQQATTVEPQLKKERDDAIEKAHDIYNGALTRELDYAIHAVANYRYLAKHAHSKQEFNYQDKDHYKDHQSYLALLELIRSNSQGEKA